MTPSEHAKQSEGREDGQQRHLVDQLSIHELIQRTGCATLLDEATRRLAGTIDATDTDEGLERVQTELVSRFFDAVRSVIRKENERRPPRPPSPGEQLTVSS